MERIIRIDIDDEKYLYHRYNNSVVSSNLIEYMIDKTKHFDRIDTYKIIINNNINEKDVIKLIKEGLSKEYDRCQKEYRRNNIIQLIYFIIGVFILFLSTLINDTVFKEIVLIGGWVLIWTMLESEIFSDFKNVSRRKIIDKLLNSEYIEK